MKVVIKQAGKQIDEIAIADGVTLSVGRQPDVNDIVVTDIKASRKHGRLTVRDGKVQFEDLGSGNGTIIGGEKVEPNKPVDLRPGTEILIGATAVIVEEGDVAGAIPAVPDGSGESTVPEGKTGMLAGVDGALAGEKYGLGDRSLFLGRVPACHIQIRDTLASRRNTEITRDGNEYKVKDLASSNGTFVNDKKIDEVVLHDGDVLRVGEVHLRFSFVDAALAPAVPTPQAITPPSPSMEETGTVMEPLKHAAGSLLGPAIIATVVIGLGVVGGALYYFTRGDETPAISENGTEAASHLPATEKIYPVRIGKPSTIDLNVTLEKTANVHPAKQITVPFEIGLKVEALHVQDQQRVKKGAKLIRFEMTDALRTGRMQVIASVNSAQAEVRKAERAFRNAEDNLKIAQEAYAKNKAIYDGGNLIQSEWDKIRKSRNNARTDVDVRKQEKMQAGEKVQQAKADLDKVQSRIDDLTVTAKTGGVVNGLHLKKGDTITPATQSMSILEYEAEVKVIAAIPEDDITRVREGMKADVWLSRAPDRVFPGTVTLIPATAEQRNYNVELMVKNKNKHFRPGAQAMVKFIVATHKSALALPAAVIGTGKRGGFHVFRYNAKDGIVEKVSIKRGVESMCEGHTYVEILPDSAAMKTLAPKDFIVFDGYKNLQDQAKVEVKNKSEFGLQ